MRDGKTLDVALAAAFADPRYQSLEPRDRAFARLLTTSVLRRHANLDAAISTFLERPLAATAERIRIILMLGAAELLLLKTPHHAAISSAVDLTKISNKTRHFEKLANAVLRRVAGINPDTFEAESDLEANFPDWMIAAWRKHYGAEAARKIAAASLREPPLDITAPGDADELARRLDALQLSTGTLRRRAGGRVEELPGYDAGAWWVQDAASAIPAGLFDLGPGQPVLDLCAAPGGKTAQLAAAGADVTAVDVSATRLDRLRANLARLNLDAHVVGADAATWRGDAPFPAVLLDAPCTATGTIRRHPDILHLKKSDDTSRLAAAQARLLDNAARLTAPGGILVYCTCSLEPAEGERIIEAFLDDKPSSGRQIKFERRPIKANEIGGHEEWITPAGDLRTLPTHLDNADDPTLSGIDGFFVARLVRRR